MRDVIRRLSCIVLIPLLTACADAATPQLEATRAAPPDPTVALPTPTPPVQASPVPATADSAADTSQPAPTEAAPDAADYNGIPQGVTDEGFYRLGDPDAPLTLIDYSDFL